MIFTTEADDLQAALRIAGRVIPQRTVWPILSNLKIITNDTRITVIGSNGDMTFEAEVPAHVETEGEACISFDALSKFVSAAKSDQVKVAIVDDMAKVTAGRNRISLQCSNIDDYPGQRISEGDTATLDAPTLCMAMRYCVAAASDEETRYYLRGVFFDEVDPDLNLWGTNGHIASRAVLSGVETVGGGGILPFDAVHILLSIAQKAELINFNISDRGWSAAIGSTRVWGKVVDGVFPDMRRMMDQFPSWSDVATIDMDRVQYGLSVGAVGSSKMSDKANKIIIKSLGDDAMIFRGGNPASGVGEPGRAEVDASIKSDFAFAANAKYLTAALTGLDADSKLTVRLADAAAMQIEPSQSSVTAQLTSLILPMRVSHVELADV